MRFFPLLLCYLLAVSSQAQTANQGNGWQLDYYLPDLAYDPSIPTPAEFLGWEVGEWHVSHDLQQAYMHSLAAASDRIQLVEYARSYEQRPLLVLIFTSPQNHQNLEALRQKHLSISQLGSAGSDQLKGVPAVLYQGFSIHGNEPSGGNAALLVAYYLAAAPMEALGSLLTENILLFDPCFNPDGFNRFASWVNSHKARQLNPDGEDREYSEPWPRGRSNHYWFDLNRDWLLAQHPESRGRVALFQQWQPNILTDHHEMGKDATFFFMPGEQSRTFPGTPAINQSLTAKIGEYHAAALDKIGSLYYSGEDFDDFYVGKGSTYPDVQGAVGILFEQASSRGHLQETENGLLSFPFTIRNQVTTALSTQAAFVDLKEELLTYQRDFYRKAKTEKGGYVVEGDQDPSRLRAFADLLGRHGIAVKQYGDYSPTALYVPLDQRQQQLVKAIFEPINSFEDSIFYDISTWTLPYAFNLPSRKTASPPTGFMPIGGMGDPNYRVEKADYAYLLTWNDYYAPRALYAIQAAGLRTKVSYQPFTTSSGRAMAAGTILIPVENQDNWTAADLHAYLDGLAASHLVEIVPLNSGNVRAGSMLGSRDNFATLRQPSILLLIDGGVNSLDAGEVWHLLDQRFDMPLTKMELSRVAAADLSRYNVIVMVDGNYNELGSAGTEKLKNWMGPGKVLVTQKRAATWAAANGLAKISTKAYEPEKDEKKDRSHRRPYNAQARDQGAKVLGGAIFNTQADLSHPLLFGYQRPEIPVFKRGTLLFEPTENDYATPLLYTPQPLLSGYSPPKFTEQVAGTAAIIVSGSRGGTTICFGDNPNFRAFFYGTNRLFMNALFFGDVISGSTKE